MTNEPEKIIYSMLKVSKTHGDKTVIKDISLSYFYGAKIGVLGLNGAGKSTVLKIMAGVDKDFDGEVSMAPNFTVGYLEQEPLVDSEKTVTGVVEEGMQELVDLVRAYNECSDKFAEPMSDDEMAALIEKQGELGAKIGAADAVDVG